MQFERGFGHLSIAVGLGCGVLLTSLVIGIAISQELTLVASIVTVVALWVLFFFYPQVGLAVHVVGFDLYLIAFDLVGVKTSSITTGVFYTLLVTSYIAGFLRQKPRGFLSVLSSRPFLILVLFILWMMASWLIFSPNNDFADRKMSFVPLLMLGPFVGALLLPSKRVKQVSWFVVLIGAFSVTLAIYNISVSGIGQIMRLAISSIGSPLNFAYSIGLSTLFFVGLIRKSSKYVRLVLYVAIMVAPIIIVASGSRGPLLGFLFGLLVFLIFDRFGRKQIIYAVLVAIFLGPFFLPSVTQLVPEQAVHRIQLGGSAVRTLRTGEGNLERETSGRSDIWQRSLSLWTEHPIRGIGVGNYKVYDYQGQFPHNVLLEVLSELGLVGFCIFGWFFLTVGQSAIQLLREKVHKEWSILAMAILAYAFNCSLFSGELQASVSLWFSAGFVLGQRNSIHSDHSIRRSLVRRNH